MNRKKCGVLVVFAMIILILAYAIVCTIQVETLKKENEKMQSESAEEYKKRVDLLTDDLLKAQQQLQGTKQNNETTVKTAAEFFLTSFYNNSNSTEYDQLSKIKALVSESIYQSLLPASGHSPTDSYNFGEFSYKTWIDEIRSYYSYISETTAEVFIYCTLHVQSGESVSTSTPLIFSATMSYIGEKWIITDIHENRTIRSD